MPFPTLSYQDNLETAHALYRHTKGLPEARHLCLLSRERRARSRHALDYSAWWLSHTPAWPGHRYGKLFVDRSWGPPGKRLPGLAQVGFTIARGFGRQAADLVCGELVIDTAWSWYRFLSDSMAGALDTPVGAILAAASQPLTVDLALTYFDRAPATLAPASQGAPSDQTTFTIDDDSLALRLIRPGGDVLAPLATVASLRELALRIESVQDLTWYWIDLRIYAKAWYASAGPEVGARWDAVHLWECLLAPWLPWVH